MPNSRLFPFGIAVLIYNLVGSVAAWILGWPPQFGGSPDPEQPYVSYLWGGSAIAAPLPLLVGLAVGLLLSRRRDVWRIVGLVIVGIVSILFVIGGTGEIVAEHEHVPRAAVLFFGGIAVLLGVIQLLLTVREWRRQGSTPS
jgi:uncharacterized membrane protein